MAIETEIKLRVDDLEGLRRRLESLRGVLRAARHFEDNYVFDFPDGSTRSRGCLVRIRNAGPKWLLGIPCMSLFASRRRSVTCGREHGPVPSSRLSPREKSASGCG